MVSHASAEPSRFFARFVALLSVAFGAFIPAGWLFGFDALTNLVPGWPRVSRLTALGFLFAGLALWLATTDRTRLASLAAVVPIAAGLLALLRYALNWDVYIDQLSLGPFPP